MGDGSGSRVRSGRRLGAGLDHLGDGDEAEAGGAQVADDPGERGGGRVGAGRGVEVQLDDGAVGDVGDDALVDAIGGDGRVPILAAYAPADRQVALGGDDGAD